MYYVYATKMDESTVHSVETYVPCVKVKNGWDKKEGHRINFTIWTYRGQLELYRYWICLHIMGESKRHMADSMCMVDN